MIDISMVDCKQAILFLSRRSCGSLHFAKTSGEMERFRQIRFKANVETGCGK